MRALLSELVQTNSVNPSLSPGAPGESAVQYQLARTLQALGRKNEAQLAFARVSRLKAQANSDAIVMK